MENMKFNESFIERIWITSDTHYGHKNICRGTTEWDLSKRASRTGGNVLGVRDFDTVEEMNQAIVNGINIVPENDILFHLGDWSFGGEQNVMAFWKQIKCQTIFFVQGNHDQHIEKYKSQMNGWHSEGTSENHKNGISPDFGFHQYVELQIGKHMKFCLFHFPIESWNEIGRSSYHLHGHMHWQGDKRFGNGRKMDIGMDGNGLRPYRLVDVIDLLKERKHYDEQDHHTWG